MEADTSGFMNILGVIPARAGSQGVPGKNIKLLGGVPLLGHTIQVAKQAGCLERLWVSTDDEKIAEVAKSFGVTVPWLRPKELATSEASMVDVLLHLLERFQKDEDYKPDAVLILQPTSPFRTPATIIRAVELFRKHQGATVISVTPTRHHPAWMYHIDPVGGHLGRFVPQTGAPAPRQKLSELYILDGSIHLISVAQFLRTKSFYGEKDYPIVVPEEEAIDIDTPFDWKIAEAFWKV